jgi:hypothetical protein
MWSAQDMLTVIISNWWITERFNQQLMAFCSNYRSADWQSACSDSCVDINWVCCYTAAMISMQFISISCCTFMWSFSSEHFGILCWTKVRYNIELLFLVENYIRRNLARIMFVNFVYQYQNKTRIEPKKVVLSIVSRKRASLKHLFFKPQNS